MPGAIWVVESWLVLKWGPKKDFNGGTICLYNNYGTKRLFLKIFVINPCTKVLKSLHNLFGSFPLLLIWILKFHIRALQLLKLAAVDRNKIYPMLIHFDFHNRLQEWKLNCSYNVMFVNNKVNQIVKCFDAIWVADFFYWMMHISQIALKIVKWRFLNMHYSISLCVI